MIDALTVAFEALSKVKGALPKCVVLADESRRLAPLP